MNRINPEKLLLSKWTASVVQNKERHFIVTRVYRNENEKVTTCDLQSLMTKKDYRIDWQQLTDSAKWITGWK